MASQDIRKIANRIYTQNPEGPLAISEYIDCPYRISTGDIRKLRLSQGFGIYFPGTFITGNVLEFSKQK